MRNDRVRTPSPTFKCGFCTTFGTLAQDAGRSLPSSLPPSPRAHRINSSSFRLCTLYTFSKRVVTVLAVIARVRPPTISFENRAVNQLYEAHTSTSLLQLVTMTTNRTRSEHVSTKLTALRNRSNHVFGYAFVRRTLARFAEIRTA